MAMISPICWLCSAEGQDILGDRLRPLADVGHHLGRIAHRRDPIIGHAIRLIRRLGDQLRHRHGMLGGGAHFIHGGSRLGDRRRLLGRPRRLLRGGGGDLRPGAGEVLRPCLQFADDLAQVYDIRSKAGPSTSCDDMWTDFCRQFATRDRIRRAGHPVLVGDHVAESSGELADFIARVKFDPLILTPFRDCRRGARQPAE